MPATKERRVNRKWAERHEAVAILAQNPNLTAEDALSLLFNAPSGSLMADANKLQSGLLAQQEQELARVTAEIERRKLAIAQTTPQESPADADAAKVAADAAALAAQIDARLNEAPEVQGVEETPEFVAFEKLGEKLTAEVRQGKGRRSA